MKIKNIVYLLLILLLITGCSSKNEEKVNGETSNNSDFTYEEDKSVEIAEKGVLHIVKKEYEDFRKMSTEQVAEALTDEVLADVEAKVLNPSGEFVELIKNKFSEVKAEDGNKYAQVLVHAKYTKSDRVYTVIIDTDYKISGFFVK